MVSARVWRIRRVFERDYLCLVLFVMHLGASRADAEDAAQEAMTAACQKWAEIRAPRPWVRKVAMRAYLHAAGAAKATSPLEEAHAEPSASDLYLAIFHEEQQLVMTLIRQLPEQQWKVTALYYDGLRTDKIARLLGKPDSTVRSLLRYARKSIREVVQSKDDHATMGP
jgi:RNA polymerase sigma factor (sigma-70 family)